MTKARYKVSPEGEIWTVSRDDRVVATYPTRPGAILAGVELAKSEIPSELYLLAPDGEVEERLDLTAAEQMEGSERLRRIEREGPQVRLYLEGDLDHAPWLVQVMREIMDELDDPGLERFVVDMGGVTGFDMQSAALWVGLERFVREKGRRLVIINASPAVLGVLGPSR